jgi:DNA-binding transcriptional ArsR family regulator
MEEVEKTGGESKIKVQKSTHKDNLNLVIFQLLKKGISPSKLNKENIEENSICSILKLKKSALSYHLSLLKRSNHIKRISNGTWILLKEEYEQKEIDKVQKSTQVANETMGNHLNLLKPNNSRGHAFMFVVKVPNKLRNWNKREEILKKLEIKYENLKNLGNGQKLEIKGRKIHLKNNSIIIYETMSYLAEMASGSKKQAVYSLLSTMKSIERELHANFSIKGNYQFKVARSHYALVKNALAKQYDHKKKKLQVFNGNGLWFLIDNSFNLHEAEIIQNKEGDKKAIDRTEGMANFMNDLDKTNYETTPTFLLKSFNEQNKQIGQLTKNMNYYGKNIVSHVGAIRKLGSAVEELTNQVKLLQEENKKLRDKKVQ